MAKITVMTDSNSGITQSEAKELGIRVIPMPFTIDGEEYLEDITLTQEVFYEKLVNDAEVSTSQPSIGYVNSVWDEVLEEYDQIIYIPMSSGLSKSCETAMLSAKANYEGKVYVVDNRRISVTQRQSVMDALELIKKNKTAEEIVDILLDNSMKSDIFIMVDTLKYLKKGGRITPAAAAVGNLLKIKPILLIKGDKLDKHRMLNRTFANAERIMIDSIKECINGYMKELDGRTDNISLGMAYTGTNMENINHFYGLVKEEFPDKEIIVNPLSLSVSCHIGDGAIAITVTKNIDAE